MIPKSFKLCSAEKLNIGFKWMHVKSVHWISLDIDNLLAEYSLITFFDILMATLSAVNKLGL